jgi:hypothetical protein
VGNGKGIREGEKETGRVKSEGTGKGEGCPCRGRGNGKR